VTDAAQPVDPAALFRAAIGSVPPPIELAMEVMPAQLQSYLELRDTVTSGPLPPEYVSLLLSVLDVSSDNVEGALSHGRAALDRGLPWDGLLQAYSLMWLVQGFASTWGKAGWRVIAALKAERDAGPA